MLDSFLDPAKMVDLASDTHDVTVAKEGAGFDAPAGTYGSRPAGPSGRWLGKRADKLGGTRIGRKVYRKLMGCDALVLTTIGRKSRIERTARVGCFPGTDGSWLIVAAAGGTAANPAWYYNLAAHPDNVQVVIEGRKVAVTAEQLHGTERAESWQHITAASPQFARFQRKTDRDLPVIRLTPDPAPGHSSIDARAGRRSRDSRLRGAGSRRRYVGLADRDRRPLRERIEEWNRRYPDSPVRRELYRLPVVLWRLGLGALVGRPLMLLTVTGRSSGLPRRTPVHPHVVGGRTYVWCPYGGRSQWYRNLIANPVVTVQSRRGTQVMRAIAIEDDDEAAEVVSDLRRFDVPYLRRYLAAEGIADTPQDIASNRKRLHIRRLVPTPEQGPPPLSADLVWLWLVPVLAAARIVGRRRRR